MDIDMKAPGIDEITGDDPPLDVIAHGLVFGEGPVWDRREQRLLFTEIIGDAIWEYRPGVGAKRLIHPSSHANGMTFDRDGRLLVAGWSKRTIWRQIRMGQWSTSHPATTARNSTARTTSWCAPTVRSTGPTRPAAW